MKRTYLMESAPLAVLLVVASVGCSPTSITLEGLSARVTVAVDARGIPHVSCRTDEDCVRVQGYLHAQDRFFQMDVARRTGRGRLATLMGASALDADVGMRLVLSTDQGEPLEEVDWGEIRGTDLGDLTEAYTDGVNAWLHTARNDPEGAGWSAEYDPLGVVPSAVDDWEPEDTVAVFRSATYALSDHTPQEIQAGLAFASLPPEVTADLLDPQPATDSAIVPASGGTRSAPPSVDGAVAAREIAARLAPARGVLDQAAERMSAILAASPGITAGGSNGWALAPDRTATGSAVFAFDPHLRMTNPPVYYLMHLDAVSRGDGTLHIAGATMPGYPGMAGGHTSDLAVGYTTANYDLADAYIETLTSSGGGVIIDGEEVPFVEIEQGFDVAHAAPEARTLRFVPGHGPVVALDVEGGVAVSIRWVGAELTEASLFTVLRGRSVAEVQDAADFRWIDQCMVLADREGHIGMVAPASLPSRPWASSTLPPWLPLPGDGSAEWDGFVSAEELPSLTDPPAGFIAAANNDLTGHLSDGDGTNDDHPYLQSYPSPGYRHQRIVAQLDEGGDDHDVASSEALQADVWVGPAPLITQHVLAIAAEADSLSPFAAPVVEALEAWQYTCPSGLAGPDPDDPVDPATVQESAGCAAFHAAALATVVRAVGDDFEAVGLDPFVHTDEIMAGLSRAFDAPESLPGGGVFWDDVGTPGATETREEVVIAGLGLAGQWLVLFVDPDPDRWAWGRVHTLTLRSALSAHDIEGYDDGPWVNDGGMYTVDAAGPGNAMMEQTGGPVMRMVVDLDPDGVRSSFSLGGSQRGAAGDDDLLADYLDNTYFAMPFTRREVREQAVEEVRFVPR